MTTKLARGSPRLASGGGHRSKQLALPGKRVTDDRIEVVELRTPAKDVTDAVSFRYQSVGIAGAPRTHTNRKINLRADRFTEAITSSTENPRP